MFPTYRALLKDNRLEQLDDKPLLTDKTATVYVTLIEEPQTTTSPSQATEILAKIAELNGSIKQIIDPVEWQRETRQDRPLPFKNHYESVD